MLTLSIDHRVLNETTHVDVLCCCFSRKISIIHLCSQLCGNTERDPPSISVATVIIVHCCKGVLYSSLIEKSKDSISMAGT